MGEESRKWATFKSKLKTLGKWSFKTILPAALALLGGGSILGLAITPLITEIAQKLSEKKIKISNQENINHFIKDLFEKGDEKIIESIESSLVEENTGVPPELIKTQLQAILVPAISEIHAIKNLISENYFEQTDLKEFLIQWIQEQKNNSEIIQQQIATIGIAIEEQKNNMDQSQKETASRLYAIETNLSSLYSLLSKRIIQNIQSNFSYENISAIDNLDLLFEYASIHFSQTYMASRYGDEYDPERFVQIESYYNAFQKFRIHIDNPFGKKFPIFLTLAHLGHGKTWNLAWTVEQALKFRTFLPFFINLKQGFADILDSIFNTRNSAQLIEVFTLIKTKFGVNILLALDGLDEVPDYELSSFKNLLYALLKNNQNNALSIILSSRLEAWNFQHEIIAMHETINPYIWDNPNLDKIAYPNIKTNVSALLTRLTTKELDLAIETFGLQRNKFNSALYDLCSHPFILKTVSEYITEDMDQYPNPLADESFLPIFYDPKGIRRNTILYRMGIFGDTARIFTMIMSLFKSVDDVLEETEIFSTFQDSKAQNAINTILYSGILNNEEQFPKRTYKLNPQYVNLFTRIFPNLKNSSVHEVQSGCSIEDQLTAIIEIEGTLNRELKILDEYCDIKPFDFEKPINEMIKDISFNAYHKENDKIRQLFLDIGWEHLNLTSIGNLTYLEDLVVFGDKSRSGASYGKFEMNNIEALKNLKHLYLNLPKIIVSEELGNLENLKDLIIITDSIETLPQNIGNLKKLQNLHLQLRALKELPDSIGELSSLENMVIYSSNLTELPNTFGNLLNLKRLELDSYNLKSIPDSFPNLKNLEYLILKTSQSLVLPSNFADMNFKKLILSSNIVKNNPRIMAKLKLRGITYNFN